jgi:hypothetical protein
LTQERAENTVSAINSRTLSRARRTENIVRTINKRTLSKARRASYRDTSRTSCSDERWIEAHREHSIIEERTSLTSITKRFLVTKRILVTKRSFVTKKSFEESQRFISYNIFNRRSMSLSRAHDDTRKKTSFVCRISKMMIWQTTHWWILVELKKSCSNLSH